MSVWFRTNGQKAGKHKCTIEVVWFVVITKIEGQSESDIEDTHLCYVTRIYHGILRSKNSLFVLERELKMSFIDFWPFTYHFIT